jgi:RNA polymerase sigma-70 factor, ECF subfamily
VHDAARHGRPGLTDLSGTEWAAAERAARDAYGRLVAWLAFRWRDVAAAEDAVADALVAALEHWPRTGVPRSPDAWLLTAARRTLLQGRRHALVAQSPEVLATLEIEAAALDTESFPDERLGLLFVCAHPALPAAMHAPLMLQVVLGLDAATIASAFLVSPAAMAQRLVRAKATIRAEGLRFEIPETRERPERLAAVLEGIYGAYTIGSSLVSSANPAVLPADLSAEAQYLARLVARLEPDSAEAQGLLALMLLCEGRRPAQFDRDGRFVPLAAQDVRLWDRPLVEEGERLLMAAACMQTPGRFQWEAAIQSAHCQRLFTGETPWTGIVQLYEALVGCHGGLGARIGHAVAVGEAADAAAGLAALNEVAESSVASYQPYWVARAHLERRAGLPGEARASLARAVGLTADPRVRDYLLTWEHGQSPSR